MYDGGAVSDALDELKSSVIRIQALITEVGFLLDARERCRRRASRGGPRITYGGGPSALAGGLTPRAAAADELGDRELRNRRASDRQVAGEHDEALTRDIILATDMALAGRTRAEIAERLHRARSTTGRLAISEAFD